MKQKNGGWIALFLAPACILFILIFAIPLVMVFVTSLFDYRLLPRTFTFVGFSNFVQLFTEDNRFWPIFGNTVKWLFIHCIFHVTLGTLLAFILYKKPRGWKFVRVTYMIPNIISQSAIAMIFLNLYNAQYGAVNSFLKLVGLESLQHNWLFETATAFPSVTLTWFLFAGYTTTLVLAQLLSTDESLIEAAEIDGATSFQIDRLVMFPVVKKMIGTTVIMAIHATAVLHALYHHRRRPGYSHYQSAAVSIHHYEGQQLRLCQYNRSCNHSVGLHHYDADPQDLRHE